MAGKKQEVVEVLLKLSDGNTIPVLAKKAKKASKDMDDLGKASQATDRRIKGVTQQSSNATKNFSKQAQTMQGGLVAAYATIAAQVFAMSAAFQFLKNAVDMSNMHQGQEAFASITGTAYKTLTADIQAATDGQLMFKQAAEAAAIGTAAGLSADQMARLGAAAKNTSLALGRDLTDSFNRLVRGTTKAEPELLDELGIVLRLEPALKAYAASIKKPVSQLTQFEKSQAIANEVLEQAESKFGSISEEMDSGAYALSQFMVAFDELFQKLQKGVGAIAKFVLPFFTNNVLALAGALGLILAPVLKSLFGEGLANMADRATEKARLAGQAARDAADDAAYAQQKYKEARGEGGPDYSQGKKEMDSFGIKAGKGQPEGQMSQRQINAYRKSLKNRNGIAKNMDAKRRRSFERMLKRQEIALKASTGKMQGQWTRTTTWFNMKTKKMAAVYQGAMVKMKNATAMMAKGVNKAMALMGWIGIIMMIGQALVSLGKWIFGEDEAAKKEKEWNESTLERYNTLNSEMDKAIEKSRDLSAEQLMIQKGNTLASNDMVKLIKDYNKALTMADGIDEKVKASFLHTAENIDKVTGGRAKALVNAIEDEISIKKESKLINGELVEVYTEEFFIIQSIVNIMVAGSNAASKFTQSQKQLSQAVQRTLGGVKKLAGADILLAYEAYTAMSSSQLAGQKETFTSEVGKKYNIDFNKDGSLNADKSTAATTMQKLIKERNKAYERVVGISDWIGEKDLALGKDKAQHTAGTYFDNLEKALQDVKDIDKKMQDTNGELNKHIKAYNKKLGIDKKAKGLKQDILGIQTEETQLTRDMNANKLNMAKSKFGTSADIKNSQLKYKQEEQNLKLEKARQAVIGAQLQLKLALVEGDTETVKGAKEQITQAKELLMIEEEVTNQSYKQMLENQAVNLAKEEQLELTQKLKRLNLDIADATDHHKQMSEDALSYEEERYAKMYGLMIQHYKRDVLLNKQAMIQKELDKYRIKFGSQDDPESWVTGRKKVKWSSDDDFTAVPTLSDELFDTYQGDKSKVAKWVEDIGALTQEIGNLDSMLKGKGKQALDLLKGEAFVKSTNKKLTGGSAMNRFTLNPAGREVNSQMGKLGYGSPEELYDTIKKQVMQNTVLDSEAYKGLGTKEDKDKMYEAYMSAEPVEDVSKKIADNYLEAVENIRGAALESANLKIETELMSGIQNTLTDGFVSMFQAMVDGTKSFKDSMKDLAKSVLSDLAAMFAKAAALKILLAMFPGMGGMLQGIKDIPGMSRYGGEQRKFAHGGVSDGPESGYTAMLHGREAVVPLGNDRSIPVKMIGNQGGGNTVNVSISMNGQGQGSSQVSGDGMQGLGRSIGNMVQQHLQQEMRPGGLLNQQGTKGRG